MLFDDFSAIDDIDTIAQALSIQYLASAEVIDCRLFII